MSVDHTRKTPYTRGLDKLDKSLGKPDNQELILLYAPGGTGKTEFTHFIARANADKGVKVCYMTIEMPTEQLAMRYAIKRAGIKELIDFQEKRYTKEQGELIDKYYTYFKDYKGIYCVGEQKEYTIEDLLSEDPNNVGVMTYYYDMGCRMFVIDNLGKIKSDKDEWRAEGDITSKIQAWKNKYNCNVILVHHTGKSKKGQVTSMRGSQKIFDNATKVIYLERDSDPDASPADKSKLMIKKEKDSVRGDYAETECYFDRGVYVEEFVGGLYKSKKIDDILDDEKF